MDIKERITAILRIPVTDAQVETIRQNYRQFYDAPEDFARDGLITIILDDLGLSRPNGLYALLNQKVDGMDLKHADTIYSLMWGKYKDVPVYVVPVFDDAGVEALRQLGEETGTSMTNDADTLFAEVAFSDDGEAAVVIVRSGQAIDAVGEPQFTISDSLPGFTKGYMRRLFTRYPDVLSTYYVPFIASGNGRNPVMWIEHVSGHISGNDLGDRLASWYQDTKVGVYEDHMKEMYKDIKADFPAIDLQNDDPLDRYRMFSYAGKYSIMYNRNHLAYNGNIAYSECLLPYLVCCMIEIDRLETNLYDVVRGNYGVEWKDLYFRRLSEQDEAEHRTAIDSASDRGDVTNSDGNDPRPQVGTMNASDGRGDGTRKSPLGKMFDNASSDYKQV